MATKSKKARATAPVGPPPGPDAGAPPAVPPAPPPDPPASAKISTVTVQLHPTSLDRIAPLSSGRYVTVQPFDLPDPASAQVQAVKGRDDLMSLLTVSGWVAVTISDYPSLPKS